MVTAKDVQGVMAMMPAFSTKDAGDLNAKNTIEVDNLKAGVERMINDGIDVITVSGSFGECYNLDWDEYKTLAAASVDAVKKRVPLFIGATSPNAREVVERLVPQEQYSEFARPRIVGTVTDAASDRFVREILQSS